MANDSLRVWTVIPGVSPDEVYASWLDGERHTAMTGGSATSAHGVGTQFTAWDGYIAGETLELEPGARILQKWRTTEFPPDAPDSLLEILLEETPEGTHLTVVQTRLPEEQVASYVSGWLDHYFEPMKRHFRGRTKSAATATLPGVPTAKKKARAAVKPKKSAAKRTAAKPKAAKKTAAKPKKSAAKKTAAKPKAAKKVAKKPTKKKAAKKPTRKPAKKLAAKKTPAKKAKKKGRSRR